MTTVIIIIYQYQGVNFHTTTFPSQTTPTRMHARTRPWTVTSPHLDPSTHFSYTEYTHYFKVCIKTHPCQSSGIYPIHACVSYIEYTHYFASLQYDIPITAMILASFMHFLPHSCIFCSHCICMHVSALHGSMYVCVCVCVYIYIYIIYIYLTCNPWAFVHSRYIHIHVCVRVRVHYYAWNILLYVYMHASALHGYMYVCVCIYIYMILSAIHWPSYFSTIYAWKCFTWLYVRMYVYT